MRTLERKGVRARLAEEFFTYCAFWVAVAALPALAVSYVVVRISKHLWLKFLSSRYPQLEFIRNDTVRSLLDTHRNQGIINVLLCVKGALDVEQIKRHVTEHLIDRRDANGDLMFPRLRHQLVSCWGKYAWDAHLLFHPENHFIVSNAVYRGRPVTENNIQDFVSDIISKYFPTDQSPWQYIIIPCAAPEPKYYILIRVHHLLLTGRQSMNIGDMLLMEQSASERIQRDNSEASPLTKLFPNPSAIPVLWEKLNENLSNAWNEFVSEYDPVESPRALKSLPGAFHVAGLVLISGISALRELSKRRSSSRDSSSVPPVTATTLIAAIQRECKRRNLTIPKILISPLVTVDPRKWPQRLFSTAVTTTKEFVKLPIRIKDELIALNEMRYSGQTRRSDTWTWKYGELGQLCARATREAWTGLVEMYRAPAKFCEDTFGADDGKRHLLQTVSLCGRKVAAWSKPVPRAGIERAARAVGVSSTDIALFAATDGIRAFFEHAHATPPETVLTTARAASEDFLFTFAEGHGKRIKKSQTGGMICLALPVGATPRRIASVVEQACKRQRALAGAWAAQARCGALTRAVPSPFAKLTLNLLSRRFAVSYAEIDAPPGSGERNTLWGQTVECVLYWRPPQANISMSLTVIQYADSVRLAVMTDARLSPAHTVPATRWPMAVEQFISKVDQEIARIRAQANPNIPQIITPQEQPPTEEIQESVDDDSESALSLRPPAPTVSSPPPFRRRVTHH